MRTIQYRNARCRSNVVYAEVDPGHGFYAGTIVLVDSIREPVRLAVVEGDSVAWPDIHPDGSLAPFDSGEIGHYSEEIIRKLADWIEDGAVLMDYIEESGVAVDLLNSLLDECEARGLTPHMRAVPVLPPITPTITPERMEKIKQAIKPELRRLGLLKRDKL